MDEEEPTSDGEIMDSKFSYSLMRCLELEYKLFK